MVRMPEDNVESSPGQGFSGPPGPMNTTALLGLAYRALGNRIVAGVVRAGFPQRPAHSAVFAHIDIADGTRLTTLASRASMTPQALGELVDDLEAQGYVVRQPDPDDRRAKRIVLTERGRSAVAAGQATIAQMEAELRAAIGEQPIEQLHATLHRLLAHADREADPG